jgi:hypothetical protein
MDRSLIHLSGLGATQIGIALRVWGKSRRVLLALCLLAGGFGVLASYAAMSGYFAGSREQPGNKEAKQPPAVLSASGAI